MLTSFISTSGITQKIQFPIQKMETFGSVMFIFHDSYQMEKRREVVSDLMGHDALHDIDYYVHGYSDPDCMGNDLKLDIIDPGKLRKIIDAPNKTLMSNIKFHDNKISFSIYPYKSCFHVYRMVEQWVEDTGIERPVFEMAVFRNYLGNFRTDICNLDEEVYTFLKLQYG